MIEVDQTVNVVGWGTCFPDSVDVSNLDLLRKNPETADKDAKVHDKLSQHILDTYGFEKRRFVHFPGSPLSSEGETSETLALGALRNTLARASGADLQALVLGSTTSRRYTGSQATAVLGALGLQAAAFESKAGCSTSLVSLQLALGLLNQGYSSVGLVCSETLSKVMHPDIRETWFGLADGAAGILLEGAASSRPGQRFVINRMVYGTDGKHVDLYTTPGLLPPTREEIERKAYYLAGDSSSLGTLAHQHYSQMIRTLLPTADDRKKVRWVVPHQVNRSLISKLMQEQELSSAEMVWVANRIGNLGGAAVLSAFADLLESGRVQSGDSVLLCSVGGGLSYAAQLWTKV